jgi:hypothetical protein
MDPLASAALLRDHAAAYSKQWLEPRDERASRVGPLRALLLLRRSGGRLGKEPIAAPARSTS